MISYCAAVKSVNIRDELIFKDRNRYIKVNMLNENKNQVK